MAFSGTKAKLTIEESTRPHVVNYNSTMDFSDEGRSITVYQPVLSGENYPLFTGRIQFAAWEVWTDEPPEKHESAKKEALKSAHQTLQVILREVTENL